MMGKYFSSSTASRCILYRCVDLTADWFLPIPLWAAANCLWDVTLLSLSRTRGFVLSLEVWTRGLWCTRCWEWFWFKSFNSNCSSCQTVKHITAYRGKVCYWYVCCNCICSRLADTQVKWVCLNTADYTTDYHKLKFCSLNTADYHRLNFCSTSDP